MTIQKPKGSLPVLIRFRSTSCDKDRYVLTDIPLDALQEMHDRFMSEVGGTSEEFVSYVYDSLGKDSPRIFRDIDCMFLREKPFITYHLVIMRIWPMRTRFLRRAQSPSAKQTMA